MEIPGLQIAADGDEPVYRQIAEAIQTAARRGAMAEGQRLPATRDLARQLGVNRNTVVAAYDALAAEGWVTGQTGRGTFLTIPVDPETTTQEGRLAGFSRAAGALDQDGLQAIFSMVHVREGISFVGAYPNAALLPVEAFGQSMRAALSELGGEALSYGPTAGYLPLRESLAASMRAADPTGVTADQVLVTNGAQQALDLAFRAFIDPGDVALIEQPTYTGALSVLQALGARTVGVATDEHGVRPEALEHALERHRPKLVYLQPTFQNPTGAVLTEERRRQVLEHVRRFRVPVVEDDWAGDLRFDGRSVPSLFALDGGRHVIYLSTFSKKLMPGLRLGWMAAPPPAMRRLVEMKRVQDCGTSPLLQVALQAFLQDGGLDRHLERIRPAYLARRDRMLAGLRDHMPADAQWSRPDGGLFIWLRLPDGIDGDDLHLAARQAGVHYSRGPLFHHDGSGRQCLRLAYSAATLEEIDRGVAILGRLIGERMHRSSSEQNDRLEAMPIL